MRARQYEARRQRGAALIIVLLFVATLSFIILGLAQRMTYSVQRTAGGAVRGELLWRVMSLETLARAGFREAASQNEESGAKFTRDHPLFAADIDLPMPHGAGAMRFSDATRCFNLNSLVGGGDDERELNEDAVEELIAIGEAVGLGASEAEKIAHVAADWIDGDTIQEISGAEDSLYTSLPTPFRTGSTSLASVSELRAMDGVTAALYEAVEPHLCAHPTNEPSQVNVNMLREQDAPVLVGLTGGALSRLAAEEIISRTPPGGWDSVEAFWSQQGLADLEIAEEGRSRAVVASRYLEVTGRASVNKIDIAVRLFFLSPPESGEISLISRELGAAH